MMKGLFNVIISLIQALSPTLAGILDKMKAKNPLVWAVVVVVLCSAFIGIDFLTKSGIINEDTAFWMKLIDMVVLAATGSRTTEILKNTGNANGN